VLLYRVFPWLPTAGPAEPGSPLYVPPQGGGRIDNPTAYPVFYAGDTAEGAIAEAFGRFPEWSPAILAASPALPGSTRAIATYSLLEGAGICDLNDARQLLELNLRPSDVLTRDYARSRAWALAIHSQRRWAGIRWWSWYNPDWSSFGLWDTSGLVLQDAARLNIDTPAFQRAARMIARPIAP
jgi:hypothetical protein